MLNIKHIGTVGSVLDAAWEAAGNRALPVFDSILASVQTAGRGQYRRAWVSPEGNLYAALRLPGTPPFLGTEAAVAIGAWIADALCQAGYPAALKWPNDVTVQIHDRPFKVCGILLEERNGIVIAGIGVNISLAPGISQIREDTALEASSLQTAAEVYGLTQPTVNNVWDLLLKNIYSSYTSNIGQLRAWKPVAVQHLLWRDMPVTLVDGEKQTSGILREVGPKGELILETDGALQAFLRGSIRPLRLESRQAKEKE